MLGILMLTSTEDIRMSFRNSKWSDVQQIFVATRYFISNLTASCLFQGCPTLLKVKGLAEIKGGRNRK